MHYLGFFEEFHQCFTTRAILLLTHMLLGQISTEFLKLTIVLDFERTLFLSTQMTVEGLYFFGQWLGHANAITMVPFVAIITGSLNKRLKSKIILKSNRKSLVYKKRRFNIWCNVYALKVMEVIMPLSIKFSFNDDYYLRHFLRIFGQNKKKFTIFFNFDQKFVKKSKIMISIKCKFNDLDTNLSNHVKINK